MEAINHFMRLKTKLLVGWILLLLWAQPGPAATEALSEFGNPYIWVTLGRVQVKAETVRTPGKLSLGLGYRDQLPAGRGMLFFLPLREIQTFCMRGMQIPLDIIWITQGKVVGIEAQVSPSYEGSLFSPEPVEFVLEVPGGFAAQNGIKPGTPVTW
jgi:uncharacterized protein